MIACVDVAYRNDCAYAACVVFPHWRAVQSDEEVVERIDGVAAYEPGAFARRELPCILRTIERVKSPVDTVVIDGFVTLSGDGKPGLGAALYDALRGKVAVIGVAKTHFDGAQAREVLRGHSTRPLYITALGMAEEEAAEHIRSMHGQARIPTLLKRVDALSRLAASQ